MPSNAVLNVALFEKRHKWPSYVKDFIFEEVNKGYDQRDFSTFEGIATIKLLGWKAKGIKAINLYLSGLVGATISVLNAAYNVGIYVKLFHYSNIINNWIPQTLDFFPIPSGIIFKTPEELQIEEEELRVKEEITNKERQVIIGYVNVFNKLQEHYDPDRYTWEDVYSYITREYQGCNKEYIMLMKPYFEKSMAKNQPELESYNERLRKFIEKRRGTEPLKPIFKSANIRRARKRYY